MINSRAEELCLLRSPADLKQPSAIWTVFDALLPEEESQALSKVSHAPEDFDNRCLRAGTRTATAST